jgi:hypothetical protein
MEEMEHYAYLATWPAHDGSVLGVPRCEKCGVLGPDRYMDEAEAEMREEARQHNLRAS